MATTQVTVPDIDMKKTWRQLRAAIWTFLCAFATGCFLNVIQPPDWLAGLMAFVYIIALCVFFWPYFAKRWGV